MSATLTTKRKSARDRPASSKEREGGLGERKREIDRSTRDRKPARNSVLTHTPEGSAGLSCLACSDREDQREGEGPGRSQLSDAVLKPARLASLITTRARLDRRQSSFSPHQPTSARAVAGPPLSAALSLSLCSSSLSCTSTSAAASLAHVARHLCSARSRMREIRWRVAGCGAQSGAPSTALAIMLNRFCTVDEPLSSPERSKLVEEGSVGRARSTRGAGGRQTLPTPWPIGTAHTQAPDRSRRRPGSVLHCCTVDFLRKAQS